jgi:3-phosphoshikimate 1-carboxyvinyltransferase
MGSFRIKAAPKIEGELSVPGDKSISHRAILLASLANGTCRITNFLPGEDCRATIAAMRALGVEIDEPKPSVVVVKGNKGNFSPPSGPIDCGNSGTTMRLLCGLLAPHAFECVLLGDASLSARPMRRVIDPLEKMGARIVGNGEKGLPPLHIQGGPLKGIDYVLPVASAQVKSALLLAGLFADGRTSVTEPAITRDHTERMLRYFQVPVRREGMTISVYGGAKLESRDFAVPGDISSAAFWMVAAASQPGSQLVIRNVGLNPTRSGILSVLVRMGARVREFIENPADAEPAGTIEIKGSNLHATTIGGAEIPNIIDELPILAVAAALAEGVTRIRDAAELRVKESDRLAALAKNLRLMGVKVEEYPDGLDIEGGRRLRGCTIDSFGDHRIAMAFAIAGLFASGETVIQNTECVATSYPGFSAVLEQVQKGVVFQSSYPNTP